MKKNGFTLLELIITVAIIGILMSMVVGVLMNINKVSLKTSAESKLDNSVTRTLEIIKRTVREGRVGLQHNDIFPQISGNQMTVTLVSGTAVRFVYAPPTSTRSGVIYVDNPTDIIGENITACQFIVGDARRYGASQPDNPGVQTSAGDFYLGGNMLVRITLTASVKVNGGQGMLSRTVSDTVITRVGIGQ